MEWFVNNTKKERIGSLSVSATCRDVLGAGFVQGHHPVMVDSAAPHKWA